MICSSCGQDNPALCEACGFCFECNCSCEKLRRLEPTPEEQALADAWEQGARHQRQRLAELLGLRGPQRDSEERVIEAIRGLQQAPLAIGSMPEIERRALSWALNLYHGNKTAAAEALGISRRSIYNKMERYGLRPKRLRSRKKRALLAN